MNLRNNISRWGYPLIGIELANFRFLRTWARGRQADFYNVSNRMTDQYPEGRFKQNRPLEAVQKSVRRFLIPIMGNHPHK